MTPVAPAHLTSVTVTADLSKDEVLVDRVHRGAASGLVRVGDRGGLLLRGRPQQDQLPLRQRRPTGDGPEPGHLHHHLLIHILIQVIIAVDKIINQASILNTHKKPYDLTEYS